jgi:hypothetical protein
MAQSWEQGSHLVLFEKGPVKPLKQFRFQCPTISMSLQSIASKWVQSPGKWFIDLNPTRS